MDELAQYNKARWEALAQANVEYSRPALDLTTVTARQMVNPQAIMGDVTGKDVLCLASGGGQQSAAFGLLGANVTVFDLAETQLQRDRDTAARYGLTITIEQGDMRDLSRFTTAAFDVVWQAHSINFVPDAWQVFTEVSRVLRVQGLYRLEVNNPFYQGLDDRSWDGSGYSLRSPCLDGEILLADPFWDVEGTDGKIQRVEGPREFRHTLNTLVNGLVAHGFILLGLYTEASSDPHAEPGSWEHFKAIAPPWLTFWAAYRPDVFNMQR